MKKLISIALCAVLATGSAVCADAAQIKQNKGVEILSSIVNVSDNTLNVYTYNMSSDTKSGVMFIGGTTNERYKVNFADCIGTSKTISMPASEKYARNITMGNGSGGNIHAGYTFADKGGRYIKVKIKLSEVAPGYFNSDGSHTQDGHDYKFRYEKTNDGYYDSALYFHSGGVVTGVTPDSNGCAEIYISTKIGQSVQYCTDFERVTANSVGGGGGTTGGSVPALYYGNIDLESSVNVNDVTALQRYLLGSDTDFDSLQYFYADVNRDGKRDVRDVTALQKGISNK